MCDQDQKGADVELVRAVLHAHQRAMTPPDSGWGDMSYLKGSYDHLPAFQAALKAYREHAPTNTGLGDLDLDGLESKVRVALLESEYGVWALPERGAEIPVGYAVVDTGVAALRIRNLIAAARSPQPAAPEGRMREALEGNIAELIGQCADVRVTYDSVQRRYTHIANADELAASIVRMALAALSTDSRPATEEERAEAALWRQHDARGIRCGGEGSSTTGASAHVAGATATDARRSAGWVIFCRTTDAYEWSEWPLEIQQSEASAEARVATLTAEVEAARLLWPPFPENDDEPDDVIWANYDLAKAAAIASVTSYPGTLADLDVMFYAQRLPVRPLSSGAPSPKSKPQASASTPATDEPTKPEGEA